MQKDSTTTFQSVWTLPTDEEIQKAIDEEGYHGIYTPQDVREYIKNAIYEFFKKECFSNEQ